MIKPSFQLSKLTYYEINIYNDWTYMGYFLRSNKIYYNLLEDAKDSFKVLDNYVKIDYKKSLLHKILGFAFETLYFHGKSKYAKVVEVNDDLVEELGINKDSALILSQPLFQDAMVDTEDIQERVYRDIIDIYCKGLEVYIKPHPRDTFNYEKVFNDVKVINKNLPIEILDFNPYINFNKAITISSSSINGIDIVDEKIYLGFDWLKRYVNDSL
ncbi:LST-domain-containing protein [Rhizophagus irregularis]|uniref:LST-domain-containing protein n=1 Tax=Rhizophagus irregularis TaxID=588596 RepID=A0A2N0QMC9_9GLOM|nr:LST-domain-containing protein [Rhizophagus irregularis]